jgi:hypothetical protein
LHEGGRRRKPSPTRSQDFYDNVKRKFAEERDFRLKYRPNGLSQYTYELTGELAKYEIDTYAEAPKPREAINDTVECLFIGGGFSALLTSARLREVWVESIRIRQVISARCSDGSDRS